MRFFKEGGAAEGAKSVLPVTNSPLSKKNRGKSSVKKRIKVF